MISFHISSARQQHSLPISAPSTLCLDFHILTMHHTLLVLLQLILRDSRIHIAPDGKVTFVSCQALYTLLLVDLLEFAENRVVLF